MTCTTKLLSDFNRELEFQRGVESGLIQARRSVADAVATDFVELESQLQAVPEPSDADRANWSDVTRAYVENLEECIEHILEGKADFIKLKEKL